MHTLFSLSLSLSLSHVQTHAHSHTQAKERIVESTSFRETIDLLLSTITISSVGFLITPALHLSIHHTYGTVTYWHVVACARGGDLHNDTGNYSWLYIHNIAPHKFTFFIRLTNISQFNGLFMEIYPYLITTFLPRASACI